MYRLKQASKIAHDDLKNHLMSHGYTPVDFTPGLWKHVDLDITFTLIVDEFGAKYTNLAQAQHLADTLKLKYDLSID